MSKLRYPFYIVLIILLVSFFSCDDNFNNYSTDKNQVLSFSTDTLSFDTLLSTQGTSTHQFMIYNQNEEPLMISSINLESGGQTGFRINVDGTKGISFQNVEIGAQDSLYVFVEATLPDNGENTPVLITDNIIFTTNTVQQKVVLEAYGQDVNIWKGKIIDASMVLPVEKPYLIYDSLVIKKDVELTIPKGVTFYMHNKAVLVVRGSLKAKGSIDNRIVFRGDRSDRMNGTPYDLVPKQWGGIYFASTSFNNEVEYAFIRNGSYGLYFEQSEPEQSKLKLKNTILTNTSSNLFTAFNCNIEFENCEFSNSGGILIYLNGGKYNFTHCTAANYMGWREVNATGATLVLTNSVTDTLNKVTQLPLLEANFYNSIIYGSRGTSSYISLPDTAKNKNIPLNYSFQNCLLSADSVKLSKSQTVNDCIFNKDPKFVDSNNEDGMFIYDFRPDSISPAKNTADPIIAGKVPFDMNAISRSKDEGPDMGAYEWMPTPKK